MVKRIGELKQPLRIGYFATAGYTETGGMQAFLDKIDKNGVLRFIRMFPTQVLRHKHRPGEPPELRNEEMGITGERLEKYMEKRIEAFGLEMQELDALIMIDDVDCRYCDERDEAGIAEAIANKRQALEAMARKFMKRDVPVFVMFASPEVECWFIADWSNGFGGEYAEIAFALRQFSIALFKEKNISTLECFGCPRENGSCRTKLSEVFQLAFTEDAQVVRALTGMKNPFRPYSKKVNGTSMLQRIQPDMVAENCRMYFRPVYQELLRYSERHLG